MQEERPKGKCRRNFLPGVPDGLLHLTPYPSGGAPRAQPRSASDRDLRTDLDNPPSRDLEIFGGIGCGARQEDEQPVLPKRHS